jgi:hypothetical protein
MEKGFVRPPDGRNKTNFQNVLVSIKKHWDDG